MVIDDTAFQAGDQVMTLRNNTRLDVRNGERGTLLAINTRARSMTIQMSDRTVTLPATYLDAGHVSLGYAMTVHKAQGLTVDRAFVLGTDDLYREMGYVAMSRGRTGNHLFVVGEPTREIEPLHGPSLERTNEELLTAALSTSKAQTMASAQINPLAEVPNVALVAERDQLELWVRTIPRDMTTKLAELSAQIDDREDRIARLEQEQAADRSSRRPLGHVLAGRDQRGRAAGHQLHGERHFLSQLVEHRDELTEHQARRDAMLQRHQGASTRLSAVEAEIARRVEHQVEVAIAAPGEYITRELGDRPDDPDLVDSWAEGVSIIERFRFEHDITNERKAFAGHDPRGVRHELDPIKEELEVEAVSMSLRR